MRYKNILFFLAILITLAFSGQAFSAIYTYDNSNRLASVDYGNGTVVNYTYNAAGSRISMSVTYSPSPTGSVSINGGAANTSTATVTLDLTAANPGGTATQMRFSNDNITWSAWEPYSATKTWTFPAGDGVKSIYVQLADAAGNIIGAYSSSITVATAVTASVDLAISSLTPPSSANAGTAVTVPTTAVNYGSGTSVGTYIHYYLSTDSVITSADIFLGSKTIGGLAGGASQSVTPSLMLPTNTTPGSYYIGAIVDATGVNAETNETNNTAASPITIAVSPQAGSLDLVVSSLSATGSANSGTQISVAATVKNLGAGTTVPSSLYYYLTTNPAAPGSSDILLGDSYINNLPGGGSSSVTQAVTVPAGTAAGTYYIRAAADASNTNAEIDETNNTAVSTTIAVSNNIDLTVSSVTAPATVATGTPITISTTVNNLGTASAVPSYVALYLTTNPTAAQPSDILLTVRSVSMLPGGGSSIGDSVVTLPVSVAPGTYYIRAAADSSNANPETNEANNTAVTTAIVISSGIDLMVNSVTAPATISTGTTASVSATIQNIGTGTSVLSTVNYYLTTNPTTPQPSDVFLGYGAVSPIDGGASYPVTNVVSIPASVVTGTYYIRAVADFGNTNTENNETNNTAVTTAVTVINNIDLVISGLTAPLGVSTGTIVSLPTTVKNLGIGTSVQSNVYYYLTTDPAATTPSDIYMGYKTVSGLAGGASSSVTGVVTIPAAAVPGTYYIRAVADAENTNPESDETNNATVTPAITVSSGIDFVVSSVTAPATALTGTQVTVPTTVQNIGAGTSLNSNVYYYLTTDPTATQPSDVFLGASNPIGSIGAGASYTLSNMKVTIPVATAAGTYYIRAVADGANTNPESDETNNAAVTSVITVSSGIDFAVSSITAPSAISTGTHVSVPNTVSNLGAGASALSYVNFYLTTDPAAATPYDIFIGQRSLASVSGGSGSSANTLVSIPVGGVTPGTYYIRAVADYTNTNPEIDETNNTAVTSTITVSSGIDLIVNNLTGPASAAAGTSVSIPNTVKNTGAGTGVPFYLKFYLSTDATITATDIYLGQSFIGGLPPNYSVSGTKVLTIPAGTVPGTYYIGAIADANDDNPESDETNNTAAAPITIQ